MKIEIIRGVISSTESESEESERFHFFVYNSMAYDLVETTVPLKSNLPSSRETRLSSRAFHLANKAFAELCCLFVTFI